MSSVIKNKNIIIIKQVVKANLKDDYYSKLHHLLETSHPVKKIDLHHFFIFQLIQKIIFVNIATLDF